MSGRIPKRVLISKIQLNDKKKSGRWGKPGIILCNGGRSRRAICNYVKKRTHAETKKEKMEDGPPGPNWTYAPDANFRTAVKAAYTTVEVNGEYFKTSTINTITFLDVGGETISDLTGIEGFTALTKLTCNGNSLNTSLDVTNNVKLTQLYCFDNSLNTLDVTQNIALTELACFGNSLNTLDVTNNVKLTQLYCDNNSLTSLDVTNNVNLTKLACNGNSLNTLDVTQNTALTELLCNGNSLNTLDVTQNTALQTLFCYDNSLTTLNVTNNVKLTQLYCFDNSLNTLDVTNNVNLTTLSCYDNSLNTLDVTQNTALTELLCNGNSLNTLDVTQNTALQTLFCYDNSLTTLNVYFNTLLTTLFCRNNNFTGGGTSVIITAFTDTFSGAFKASPQNTVPAGPFCKVADASAVAHFVNIIQPSQNSIPNFPTVSYFADISGATFFPDPNFYNAIITQIPIGASAAANYLYDASINTITSLDVNGANISDLTGIEGFTALTQLYCQYNSLNTLDLTNNTALTSLRCYYNSLTTLDVSGCPLTTLAASQNQLTSLDVPTTVVILELQNNSLNTLDVTQNTALTYLLCNGNSLNFLDVSACPLTFLRCDGNNFTGGGTSVIITAFDSTYGGTFQANPQNTGINPSGDFCQVADAAAVTHFNANYLNYSNIPPNGTYYS